MDSYFHIIGTDLYIGHFDDGRNAMTMKDGIDVIYNLNTMDHTKQYIDISQTLCKEYYWIPCHLDQKR